MTGSTSARDTPTIITITAIIMVTGTIMSDAALYRLLTWLSPAYPVGAFSHSGGLEWAVEVGWVTDRQSLQDWLEDVLAHGAAWNDAVFFTHARRATTRGRTDELKELIELAAAAHPSAERRLESLSQGQAFRSIAEASDPLAADLFAGIEAEIAYPIAVAMLAARHSVALEPALTAYLHAFIGNLVSAAQRLVPLGQTDAQIAIGALHEPVTAAVRRAQHLEDGDPFEALGSATLLADIASMLHETQYTRLFRT